MFVEVVIPFCEPHLAPFRKGERFELPDVQAKPLIDGKLVRQVDARQPEFAVSPSSRKAK